MARRIAENLAALVKAVIAEDSGLVTDVVVEPEITVAAMSGIGPYCLFPRYRTPPLSVIHVNYNAVGSKYPKPQPNQNKTHKYELNHRLGVLHAGYPPRTGSR